MFSQKSNLVVMIVSEILVKGLCLLLDYFTGEVEAKKTITPKHFVSNKEKLQVAKVTLP